MIEHYIGTKAEPGRLNKLSRTLNAGPLVYKCDWHEMGFAEFFADGTSFFSILKSYRRNYDFDLAKFMNRNWGIRHLTMQERTMVDTLVKDVPFDSFEAVESRIREILKEGNLNELSEGFWR